MTLTPVRSTAALQTNNVSDIKSIDNGTHLNKVNRFAGVTVNS